MIVAAAAWRTLAGLAGNPVALAGALVVGAYVYGHHVAAGEAAAAAERARAEALAVDAEAARRQRQLEAARIQEEEEADAVDRQRIAELEREVAERAAAAPPAPECPDRGRVSDAERRRLLDVGAGARRPGAARPAR